MNSSVTEKASIKNESMLGTENIPKLMFQYCFPAVIAMIIAGVQGMIDGIFVGRFVGSNALASVNIALPFIQLIVGVSMIVSIGAQSFVAISLGKGRKKRAQDCFKTFHLIIWISSSLITVLGVCFNQQIATLLGANAVLLPDSAAYVNYISLFAIPMCCMFYFGFLNRVIGKPEKYFYGFILSVIVNISLDYLFIVKMQMGVMGAALATGLAYSSALLVVIFPMLNKDNAINVFVGKLSALSIKNVLYNGASEGVNSISIAITAFLFNISLMEIAGEDGVAAFTTINYVGTLGGLLLFGVSDGIGPIVSYNFGAKNTERVKLVMKLSYVVNFIFGLMLFLLLFFTGKQLVSLFITDNAFLIELAASGGKLFGIAFLMTGFNILNSGYFTFIGKGRESVIVAASRGLVFVSVGIFALPIFLGINGIWLSIAFAELCAVIVGVILLKKSNLK